ncbi:MAG TPA: TraC family protein [Terrimicrobiaceae bacterium]
MTAEEPVSTNAGDDSEGLFAGIIEYKNLFIILGGLALSLFLTLALYHNKAVPPLKCFGVGSIPLIVGLVWVLGFRQARPKNYDLDLVETSITGKGWKPDQRQLPNPAIEQSEKAELDGSAPNGWFCDGLLVWNAIAKGGFTSKGFSFDVPFLNQASQNVRNNLYAVIRQFLHTLDEKTRVQFYWTCDSDYKDELTAYQAVTEITTNRWSRHIRAERHNRYWQAMLEGKLRRERLVVYVSRPILVDPPLSLSSAELFEHNDKVLEDHSQSYQHTLMTMRSIFESSGVRITPMGDEDHYRHITRCLNPSYITRFGYDPITQFNPELTIQENCWHGEIQGAKNFGFYYDTNFHNIVLLKRRPQHTTRGIIQHLTQLPFLDYSIALNLYPLNVRKEITKAEQSLERVRSSYAANGKHKLVTAKENKEQYIRSLSQGDTYPFAWDFAVHVWAETEPELTSRTRMVEAAINKMDDAQYWTTNTSSPATTKKMWYQTWPGWLWGKYTAQADTGTDKWLADLLPFSSSFTGHLDGAEALYDGPNGSLVGIRTFISDTPQLAAIFGMSRSGKSFTTTDLMSQIAPYFGFQLLIEEGNSYGIYTQTQGNKPIVVHPDGNLTINYLDTHGLPLTQLHLDMAAAFVCKLTASGADGETMLLRKAQLKHAIEELYDGFYEEWASLNPIKVPEVAREAIAVKKYQKEFLPSETMFTEAWLEFKHLLKANDDAAQQILSEVTENEITMFLKDPATERIVRNCVFAYFAPEEYPQHIHLYDKMAEAGDDNADFERIATLMESWNAKALVSGTSTIRLTGNIAHFELGQIPENDSHMRQVAGFLVANYARQHIVTLPRGIRKLVIFEEAARILNIPGGAAVISEFYAQLSKYSACIFSTVQQYAMFKNSPVRPVIMGNSAIKIFMKFEDRQDLEDVAKDIALSEPAKESILRYPRPDHQAEADKWSGFTYHHIDAQYPLCGSVINRVCPAMNFAASTKGTEYDARAKQLKTYDDVVTGIIEEAAKPWKPLPPLSSPPCDR